VSRRVYLHVGLPKTGTSYLQRSLWLSKDQLARHGVAVPGPAHQFQRRAVWDLMGRRLQGVDQPHVPGSWRALVDEIHAASQPTVLVSEEFLVHARQGHVRRVLRDLAPLEVDLVVTVRDLTHAIGSMWQHEVSQGATWSWPEFASAVRDPEAGPPSAGVGFWLRYDLRSLLALWEAAVPPERIHVVVVPPEGSSPTQLLERFATAIGLAGGVLVPPQAKVNTSVGVAGTELIRRLNVELGGRLNERQYLRVFDNAVKPALRARPTSARVRMPDDLRPWLSGYSKELIELLQSTPYDVVGDVNDLVPTPSAFEGTDPEAVDASELLAAALAALTGTVDDYARFWWKVRRRKEAEQASATSRLTSSARAIGFSGRVRALELADRNAVFAWAARQYLRRRRGVG
jgi:hypothetical protein